MEFAYMLPCAYYRFQQLLTIFTNLLIFWLRSKKCLSRYSNWGFISKLKQNWRIPEIDDTGPCEDLGPRTLQRGPWSTTLRRSRTQDPMRGQDPGPCWENAKSRTLRGPRTHEPFERIQDSEPCYDLGPRIEPYWMDPGSKTRSRGPRTHRTVLRTRKFVERTVNF